MAVLCYSTHKQFENDLYVNGYCPFPFGPITEETIFCQNKDKKIFKSSFDILGQTELLAYKTPVGINPLPLDAYLEKIEKIKTAFVAKKLPQRTGTTMFLFKHKQAIAYFLIRLEQCCNKMMIMEVSEKDSQDLFNMYNRKITDYKTAFNIQPSIFN